MAVFTFSTKSKKPEDTAAVEALKEYCDVRGIHFSAMVIKLIKESGICPPKKQSTK